MGKAAAPGVDRSGAAGYLCVAMRQTATTKRKGLTVANVMEALQAQDGNLSAAAKSLGVGRSSLYRFIENRPELQQVLADAREASIDLAENALRKAVERGEGWATCFLLKTIGRSRGYIERQEQTHEGSIQVIVKREQRTGTTKQD